MAMSIANNVSSLNAQHNLGRASSSLAKSTERLSSGLKINRGADGPAALVISEKQRAQIAGLRQAIDNADKATAVVQTAEGALNEINSLLVKVRSLALDSANSGVNDEDALAANQAEIDNALDTINRIANNTQFGQRRLLDGSSGIKATSGDVDVTVLKTTDATKGGVHAINVTTAAERANVSGSVTTTLAADETLTVNGVEIGLTNGMDQDEVVARINEFSAQTGVVADKNGTGGATRLYTNQFGADASITVTSTNTAAAGATNSGFTTTSVSDTGVDIAGTIGGAAASGKGNVLTSTTGDAEGMAVQVAAGTGATATTSATGAQGNVNTVDNSLVFQIGPNQNQTAKIGIGRINPNGLGVGVADNQFANLNEIEVTSASKAQDALGVIDAAIDEITNLRGKLGAFQQNTLASTTNNLQATLENTVNAESVIRDTDFATEVAEFTKQQVLVQAGANVLKNANQQPQLALSLLN